MAKKVAKRKSNELIKEIEECTSLVDFYKKKEKILNALSETL